VSGPTCVFCCEPACQEQRYELAPLCRECYRAEKRGGLLAIGRRLDRLNAAVLSIPPEAHQPAGAEPAPDPAQRWRCEGCGGELEPGLVSRAATEHHPAMAHPVGDAWCGPVVPVLDAQPAGAADGEAGS
jgi:hypothetical protein